MFPGQGAQFVGMGRTLAEQFSRSRNVFERADDALGQDLSGLCWNGPEDVLRLTENAQPAILVTSVAYLEALKTYGVSAVMTAGLSLGEYTALVAAGSIGLEDAVRLVRERGRIMQQAVPDGVGAMAAILGLDSKLVEKACQEAAHLGVVQAVNYNCPGQLVISGERNAVMEAGKLALGYGAKRVIPLAVSAPFHCSLMAPAAERMAMVLRASNIEKADIPVYANATASAVTEPEQIRNALVMQIASPVLWEQCVRQMLEDGAHTFIEVGPGKTLTGFLKKISPETPCFSFDSRESLESILESARVGC